MPVFFLIIVIRKSIIMTHCENKQIKMGNTDTIKYIIFFKLTEYKKLIGLYIF